VKVLRLSRALAVGLAGCVTVFSALAAPGTRVQSRDELTCGSLKAEVHSVWLSFEGQDSPASQLLEQSLSFSVDGGPPKTMPLDGRPLRKKRAGDPKALDAALTSWACLTEGKSPPYLFLTYSCTEGQDSGACVGGVREWDRLYDSRGRHLTVGLKRQDARRDALYRAQGLQEVMRRGVTLTGLSR
jgi:hypothetical protein